MAKYNFDEIIERKNTNSLKYDFATRRGKPEDVLPLWVADMDFKTSPKIVEALKAKADHAIFGYSEPLESYFDALKNWFLKHYNWTPNERKFLLVPGVVFGICAAIKALTKEGDSILINQPVYYPFKEAILDNGRKLINSNLVYKDNKYFLDFADLEEKIKVNNVKIYVLCNPHNPVGRVWSREELEKIYEITKKYNVVVISDEIHADFTYSGINFTSYATIASDVLDNSIIATSASKTFNLAGLHNANIYIANDRIRRLVRHQINAIGYSQPNVMGLIATEAAYKYGEDWYIELKDYLASNLQYVREFISKKLKGVKLIEPEGTYLIWIDFGGLNITDERLNDIIINKAKLWLDEGNIFGKSGENFERINIACPKAILKEAFERLYKALVEEKII